MGWFLIRYGHFILKLNIAIHLSGSSLYEIPKYEVRWIVHMIITNEKTRNIDKGYIVIILLFLLLLNDNSDTFNMLIDIPDSFIKFID